jgi:hypothetical protein
MTTYVLVGGAWLGGWCWQKVARQLRDDGHDVYPVTLTGLGERVHLASAHPNKYPVNNHISHMAYAGDNGCPKDHPQVFPRLILTVKYATSLGANSQLAPATGDASSDPGTGFHADYFEAWKTNAALREGGTADSLQYFVDHCIKAGINCRDGDMLPQ